MPIPESLCCLALNQLEVHRVLLVIRVASASMTDQSRGLLDALERSNRKAWKALEVALAGESLWSRLDRGDVKSLRAQIRGFLDHMPLPELTGKDEFRRRCVGEIREAFKKGVLLGNLVAGELAEKTGRFAAYSDPAALLKAEKSALTRLGKDVQDAGFRTLGWLLAQPAHGEQSVVVVAARYFFRREIETNSELFRGLQFAATESLGESQRAGFAELDTALTRAADRLEEALAEVATEILAAVADVRADVQAMSAELQAQMVAVLAKLDMANKPVQPEHSMAVRSDREREAVRELLKKLRAAPPAAQAELASNAGKLQVAIGDYAGAAASFATVAASARDATERAEAFHNSYRARLEQKNFAAAVKDLAQAIALDATRFAPFPTDKYEVVGILGAGGFGVTFRCRHTMTGATVAVKSLTESNLDQDIGAVLREATALDKLKHRAIIGLRDCGYADTANKRRPYLVMEYFDGQTLQEYVEANGPIPLAEALPLARILAEALAAAHGQNVLHRDVKPPNVMVKRVPAGWEVRLIDFGLAMRSSMLTETMSSGRGNTMLGSSIAGTIDYAAPEQLGKLPGTKVGPPADVYGFAKTLCFALFKTAEPTIKHYKAVPDAVAELIGRCLSREPVERPQTFQHVGESLAAPVPPPLPIPVATLAPPPVPVQVAYKARTPRHSDDEEEEEREEERARRRRRWEREDDDDDDQSRRPRVPVVTTGTRIGHAVMAFFLGMFGIHKFMQGNSANGTLRLLIILTCIGLYVNLFAGLVEAVQYVLMSNEQYTNDYMVKKKNWF